MAAIPRLNNIIGALERGEIAITTFVSPPTVDNAIAVSGAPYDGVIFESEHNPYDIKELRDGMQYMLNRRQILERGTLAPAVTPLVRIPVNGAEMNQWLAKQALADAFGLDVEQVEEVWHGLRPPYRALFDWGEGGPPSGIARRRSAGVALPPD